MVRAIVGANWGDEGKGKITDLFAGQSDIVIRFQGFTFTFVAPVCADNSSNHFKNLLF